VDFVKQFSLILASLAASFCAMAQSPPGLPAAPTPSKAQPIVSPLPQGIPLWKGMAPMSHGTGENDIPEIIPFLPKLGGQRTPAVVICPGGGYGMLCMDYEGTDIGKWFADRGVAGFVLRYRLPGQGYRHPAPLLDAQRALRLVRSRAAEWNLDPKRIGIMGFSAGGHLAATLETHFDAGDAAATDAVDRESCRPNFAVLVYPVISMKAGITHQGSKDNLLGPNPDPALVESLSDETQVTAQTPPTVIAVADDDAVVPIANSRLMYAALQKAGVASALQEYPHGGHGFQGGKVPADWKEHVFDWLKGQGLVP
jgi:acetyl esterase/lipase